MSEQPTSLSDDDLSQVVGGAASAAGAGIKGGASITEGDVSGDIYAVMALFQNVAQEMRNSAREVRGAEAASQIAALKGAADQMQEAAEARMNGAIIAGAVQIGAGLTQLGTGAIGSDLSCGAKSNLSTIHASDSSDVKDRLAALGDLSSSTLPGSTALGIGASGARYGADMLDARKADLGGQVNYEAQAKMQENGTRNANDMMQQMMDVIKDVHEKLGAIEQSKVETLRGVTKNS